MDRRTFLGRTGLGAAAVALPSFAFGAGRADGRSAVRGRLVTQVAASGARGSARVWWSADTEDRVLALTFDDGPTEEFTAPVADVLDRYGVPATFFTIGELVDRRPEVVLRLHEAGHELGNHTYDHEPAEHQVFPEALATVERGADSLAAVLGDRPRWFRPVKGHVTGAVLRAAALVGHDVAIWSLQRGTPTTVADDDADGVRAHLLERVHPGAIVLLHDGVGRSSLPGEAPSDRLVRRRRAEVAVLPEVIEGWLAQGFRFVTVSELADRTGPADATAPAD